VLSTAAARIKGAGRDGANFFHLHSTFSVFFLLRTSYILLEIYTSNKIWKIITLLAVRAPTVAAHRRATPVPARRPPALASAQAEESEAEQTLLCGRRRRRRLRGSGEGYSQRFNGRWRRGRRVRGRGAGRRRKRLAAVRAFHQTTARIALLRIGRRARSANRRIQLRNKIRHLLFMPREKFQRGGCF
jgi:hypothetical protein